MRNLRIDFDDFDLPLGVNAYGPRKGMNRTLTRDGERSEAASAQHGVGPCDVVFGCTSWSAKAGDLSSFPHAPTCVGRIDRSDFTVA
jgi:hypothetical protein